MIDTGITQDLLPWNEEKPFAFTSVAIDGQNVPGKITTASRYPLGLQEAEKSNGAYTTQDEVITFDFGELVATYDGTPLVPKPRDLIRQETDRRDLVVLKVQKNAFLRFWNLTVRDLGIVYDLRDEAKLLRPTTSPGTGGLRSTTWTTIADAVPARLQIQDTELQGEVAGKVVKRIAATCFLGQALELSAGDVIEISGVKYEAKAQSNINQFDTLTQVRCERLT